MGTGARSTGWGWDYQKAEIDWRKAGGRLDGMMAVAHNAAKWEACLLYDQMDTLPACTVPMHVIAFCEDVQARLRMGARWPTSLGRRSTTSSRAWAAVRSMGTRTTS